MIAHFVFQHKTLGDMKPKQKAFKFHKFKAEILPHTRSC